MVGNNSASVVADAYLSGLRGYDMETLWQAVVHGTQAVHPQVTLQDVWDMSITISWVMCHTM
jgi:hypothetical protein